MEADAIYPSNPRGRVLSLASGSEALLPKIPSKSILRRSYAASNSSSTINSSSDLDLSCNLSSGFLYNNNHNIHLSESLESIPEMNKISLINSDRMNFSLNENLDQLKITRSSSLVESSSSNDSLNELDLTEGEGLSSGTQIFDLENKLCDSPITPVYSAISQESFSDNKKFQPQKDKFQTPKKIANPSFDEVRKKFMKQDSQKSDTLVKPKIPTRIKKLQSPFHKESSEKQEPFGKSTIINRFNSLSSQKTDSLGLKDSTLELNSNILCTTTDSFSSQNFRKSEMNKSSTGLDNVLATANASFSSQNTDSFEIKDLVIELNDNILEAADDSFSQNISSIEVNNSIIELEVSKVKDTANSCIVESTEIENSSIGSGANKIDSSSDSFSSQNIVSSKLLEPVIESYDTEVNVFCDSFSQNDISNATEDSFTESVLNKANSVVNSYSIQNSNLNGDKIADIELNANILDTTDDFIPSQIFESNETKGLDFESYKNVINDTSDSFSQNIDSDEINDFIEKDINVAGTARNSFSHSNNSVGKKNTDSEHISNTIETTDDTFSSNPIADLSEIKDSTSELDDNLVDSVADSSLAIFDENKDLNFFSKLPNSSFHVAECYQDSNYNAEHRDQKLDQSSPPTSKKSSLCFSNFESDNCFLPEKVLQNTVQKAKLTSHLEDDLSASALLNTERNSDSGFQELLETEISEDIASEASDFDEEVEICTLKKTEIFSCLSANRASNTEPHFLHLDGQRDNKLLSISKIEDLSCKSKDFSDIQEEICVESSQILQDGTQLNDAIKNSKDNMANNFEGSSISFNQSSVFVNNLNLKYVHQENSPLEEIMPNSPENHSAFPESNNVQAHFSFSDPKSSFGLPKEYNENLNLTSPTSHISHDSISKISLNSQSSVNSQHSDGSFMNKVKGLYDLFRSRNDSYFSSVNYMESKGIATATSKAPAPLNLNSVFPRSLLNINLSEKKTSRGIQLQKIPPHLHRISLFDTYSFDSRSDSLYNPEELNAENIDWEFWGQLVNSFDDMIKNNYLVLRRSIRQGIPVSMRGMVWELLAEIEDTNLVSIYSNLLIKTSPHEKTIIKDLPQTFPNLPYFKLQEGTGQELLFNVLKSYSLYDPEVGYCQGLSFLAGPLLLNMPDEEAFCVLVRIMESLRQHFTPAMEGLQVRTYQFERLMEEVIPQVFSHFQEQGIQSTMYASQWFISLFAYRSSMRLVFRVLDILLLEGSDILIKVALALLRDNVDLILSKNSNELVSYLKFEIFEQYHDQTDHIIAIACDQKLSECRMNKWSKEYMIELAKKAEEAAYASSLQGINEQLFLTNRNLAIQLDHVSASNKEMTNRLSQLQDKHSTQIRENSDLQTKINELELMLHTERQRAEAAMQEQLNILAQKNFALVTKNAELKDALLQAEETISNLKTNLSL